MINVSESIFRYTIATVLYPFARDVLNHLTRITLFISILSTDVRQWEYISYCLSQLTFNEKSIRKLIESFKTYEHALSQDTVMDHFRNIISKVLFVA